MEIKGKVHLMFEQSATFRDEFRKLGYEAYCYDIQNNFGKTDHQIDLFNEIENAYRGGQSVFDSISCDDVVLAFFPCIYFTGYTNPTYFRLECINYKSLTLDEKLEKILQRSKDRQYFYELIIKMVGVCLKRGIRLIIENPFSTQHYLYNNFFANPTIIDRDRTLRGDYFTKPTGYWFFNCEPTYGCSRQKPKEHKTIQGCKGASKGGICSEERSMISPDYARNFICDFILGKEQVHSQASLFNFND